MKMQEILDGVKTYQRITYVNSEPSGEVDETGLSVPRRIVVVMSVGKKGWGFGEFTFVTNKEGRLFVDGEGSPREEIVAAFKRMLDGAVLDSDEDPEKHRLYNENSGVLSCSCCGYEKGK